MKYAKKIMIYPPARSDPLTDKMNELDSEMSEILSKKGLSVYEKIQLYNDILTKNLSIENQYKNRFAEDDTPPPQPQPAISPDKTQKTPFKKVTIAHLLQKTPLKTPVKTPAATPMDISPSPKSQKRKLGVSFDETIRLEGADEDEVNNEDDNQVKAKKKKKRLKTVNEKGYNKNNKISREMVNNFINSWSDDKPYSIRKRTWVPLEKYDGAVTRSKQKQLNQILEEENI